MSSKKKSNSPEVMYIEIQLAVRFGHVIAPFDVLFLENRLRKLGYIVEKDRISSSTAPVGKQRIGKMEDMEVTYNNDRQVLAVKGQQPERVVKGFLELFESITELASPINLNVTFYETIVSALVKGSKNPLTVFSKLEYIFKAKELESLFGQRVSPFGVRLTPSNSEIDSPNWFEYKVEPFIIQPSSVYLCGYIYRNQNMQKTIESVNSFNELTRCLVTMIEK